LKAVKDQQDFDNALRLSQEARLNKEKTEESDEDKEIENFRKDAAEIVAKLDNGDITWGTAYDQLKIKYPQASNELIDQTLGGGYNPKKDEWYGRAK